MKIGVIANLYPPYMRGGAEQVAQRMVNEMSLNGHQVFVISTQPYDSWWKNIIKKGWKIKKIENDPIPVYRFSPINIYHQLNDFKYPIFIRVFWHLIDSISWLPNKQIQEVLDEEEPDLIITHNLKGIGLPIAHYIQKQGIKHIHTLHDVQLSVPSGLLIYNQENSFINRSFLRRFYERLSRKAIGRPDLVLSPSRFLARFHMERGFFHNTRVEVLPNPTPKMPFVHRRPYDSTVLNILFASQIEEQKGLLFLMKTLKQFNLPFKIHIAGEGVLRKQADLWSQNDKRVVYHGFMPFAKLVKLFEVTDVIVVPSLCYEGSPAIIYESLKAGIPVIASRIGGVSELINYRHNGYLIDPGSVESFTSALKKMALGVDRFYENSETIRRTVENFTPQNYLKRLENLIKEIFKSSI